MFFVLWRRVPPHGSDLPISMVDVPKTLRLMEHDGDPVPLARRGRRR